MRKKLKKMGSGNRTYTAKVGKIGKVTSVDGESLKTLLLLDVVECGENQYITNHCWIQYSKLIESSEVESGDIIKFSAVASSYYKRGKDYSARAGRQSFSDYTLRKIRNIVIIEKKLKKEEENGSTEESTS